MIWQFPHLGGSAPACSFIFRTLSHVLWGLSVTLAPNLGQLAQRKYKCQGQTDLCLILVVPLTCGVDWGMIPFSLNSNCTV